MVRGKAGHMRNSIDLLHSPTRYVGSQKASALEADDMHEREDFGGMPIIKVIRLAKMDASIPVRIGFGYAAPARKAEPSRCLEW